MIIKSFDLFEFDLEKLSPTKCILGITIGGLVLVKYLSFDKNSEIAIFPYPNNKRENFRIITKARFNKTVINDPFPVVLPVCTYKRRLVIKHFRKFF